MATKWTLPLVLGMALVYSSQGFVAFSPDYNSVSKSAVRSSLDAWNTKRTSPGAAGVVRAVEAADDQAVDKVLTAQEKRVGKPVGFPLASMSEETLVPYMNLEDKILLSQADEHVGFKLLKEQRSKKGGDQPLRRKRIAPIVGRVVFAAGRALFRRFARKDITRSGSRVTRHYSGSGRYSDAVRDFNRLRPDNVRSFSNGRISGRTGTMGRHRVTVRDGSSGNSRPTLEIRSHGGSVVRKFRYNGN
ncbi:hypothetical protein ACOMHN_045566 [Nucella lapillus]